MEFILVERDSSEVKRDQVPRRDPSFSQSSLHFGDSGFDNVERLLRGVLVLGREAAHSEAGPDDADSESSVH
jgi:hypothetical protein